MLEVTKSEMGTGGNRVILDKKREGPIIYLLRGGGGNTYDKTKKEENSSIFLSVLAEPAGLWYTESFQPRKICLSLLTFHPVEGVCWGCGEVNGSENQ